MASDSRDSRRVFASYALINVFAATEEEAAALLYEAEDRMNADPRRCFDAMLTDECYERTEDDEARPWTVPDRPEASSAAV